MCFPGATAFCRANQWPERMFRSKGWCLGCPVHFVVGAPPERFDGKLEKGGSQGDRSVCIVEKLSCQMEGPVLGVGLDFNSARLNSCESNSIPPNGSGSWGLHIPVLLRQLLNMVVTGCCARLGPSMVETLVSHICT